MTASFETHNVWHGMGAAGHVVLFVIVFAALVIAVGALMRR